MTSGAFTWSRRVATAFAIVLAACSSSAKKLDETAVALGLRRDEVTGTLFTHVLFWRPGEQNRALHVYLDGDGSPMNGGLPAEDPTPRNPLVLRLLARDPGPAVYVGRPCYNGMASTRGCSSDLWTNGRYSEPVVASTAAAIQRILSEQGRDRVSFFGYSGGGTLAMLLAERLPRTVSVVTIAANLDIDAWTDQQGYARLSDSLSPAARPPLGDDVSQRHYVGSRDRIVSPQIVARGIRGPHARLIVVEGYDHVCCWLDRWQAILADAVAAER
jgi:hypothetical protein